MRKKIRRKLERLVHSPLLANPLEKEALREFNRSKARWLAAGGRIDRNFAIKSDFMADAGSNKGHYFHQDLLVATFIFEENPVRHIDVGSRIDGFVAHVAAFRPIEVVDVRPLPSTPHKNIIFRQANLMETVEEEIADSVSCLHAIEHFGMGRYGDPTDINGHLKGIDNLVRMLKPGGKLYISFPIGKENEVHFNAHRIFHPEFIFKLSVISSEMRLLRFDYVDDDGDLHTNTPVSEAVGRFNFGCGIYTFEKAQTPC